ncbi:exonuclease domain-containing protein [Microbacterium enclense]|uniref:exonuclease domain-containing protein n=1 Tax=Microbacterium enclense TaxID=993073 RepID=UPI003F7D7794
MAMIPTSDTHILWFDLETTDLDVEQTHVLEAGAVLTDADLNEIARFHTLVRPPEGLEDLLAETPAVLDMHTRTGLLAELLATPREDLPTTSDVDLLLSDFVGKYAPGRDVCLGGSGVERFDRRIIEAQMPQLHARLPYWCADTSSTRRGYRLASGGDIVPARPVAHRAIGDIEDSLRVARVAWPMFREHEARRSAVEPTTPIDRVLTGFMLIDTFRNQPGYADSVDSLAELLSLMPATNSVAGLVDAGAMLLDMLTEATGQASSDIVGSLRARVLHDAATDS